MIARLRWEINRSAAEPETGVPPGGASRGAMTPARCATTVLASLILGGAMAACAGGPAEPRRPSTDPRQAARKSDSGPSQAPVGREPDDWGRDKGRPVAASPAPPTATGQRSASSLRDPAAGRVGAREALIEAARSGDAALVASLLAPGADLRTLNGALLAASGSAPAVEDGPPWKAEETQELSYAQTARLLLGRGAGLEARSEGGRTPLILAAGHGETGVVKLLLTRGANIEAADDGGRTALIAAACSCPAATPPDTHESVRLLLESGAHLEARDKQGGTALMAAAAWGRTWNARLLLDKGSRIEARDNSGNTALLISALGCGYPKAEVAQLLAARGADIEARNGNGDTALILAASTDGYENAKIVRMLLDRGADARVRNKQGHTALDLAAGKGRTGIVSLLEAAMANPR